MSAGLSPRDDGAAGANTRSAVRGRMSLLIHGEPSMQPDLKGTRYNRAVSVLNRAIIVLSLLFCVSLYKNISYPLLWNDESETAMTAEKVIEYGYPKVHDGKNTVFLALTPFRLGYKASCDANISIGWANYYFAAIGVLLARMTRDMYLQTALVRIPFATAGLVGLLILALAVKGVFPDTIKYRAFLTLFAFVELCSVFLILHMREARYYSLIILVSACFLYACIRRFIHEEYNFGNYMASMTLLLVIAFNVNFILYYIFCAVLLFVQAVHSVSVLVAGDPDGSGRPCKLRDWLMELLKSAAPVAGATALLAPLFVFYEIFRTSELLVRIYDFRFELYLMHIRMILKYFSEMELLYAAAALKICVLFGWLYMKLTGAPGGGYRSLRSEYRKMLRLSSLLAAFLVIYSLIIANIPSHLFVRYYIVLQPVMVAMMLTDLFITFGYIHVLVAPSKRMRTKTCLAMTVAILCLVTFYRTSGYIKGYVYQLTHQYKGPLDYIIPWIQGNTSNTEKLVVATNYEECSYMYYLHCKVTIGYIGMNLEDDLRYPPDIIIERKAYDRMHELFTRLLRRGNYIRVSFPVCDSPVNNIPDPFFIGHLFETRYAEDESGRTDIFVRPRDTLRRRP